MNGHQQDAGHDKQEVMTSRQPLYNPSFLRRGSEQTLAVGLVEVSPLAEYQGKSGTCFFVTPNIVLTCYHVISSEVEAIKTTFTFHYERPELGAVPQSPVTYRARPGGLYVSDAVLDFAFVELLNVPLGQYSPFQLESELGMGPGGSISIIQHPGGGPQKFALGQDDIKTVGGRYFTYNAPTDKGSSGAPICNLTWQAIGVHVGAANNEVLNQDEGYSSATEIGQNMGITSKAILATLATRDKEPRVAELLAVLALSASGNASLSPNQKIVVDHARFTLPLFQRISRSFSRIPWVLRIILLLATLGIVVITPLFFRAATAHQPSPFDYHYQAPLHSGGNITVGVVGNQIPNLGAIPPLSNVGAGLWSTCLTQLPNLGLGSQGFKLDQCDRFPDYTISLHDMILTLHFDPSHTWSDGQPITASDYALGFVINRDPAINGDFPYYLVNGVQVVNPFTLKVQLDQPYAGYLFLAAYTFPIPLHLFPGIYDPQTGAYDSKAALTMLNSDAYVTPHVVNGPYQIQSLTSNPQEQSVMLAPNPHYRSHFYHQPVVSSILFRFDGSPDQVIANYRAGHYDLVPRLSYFDTYEQLKPLAPNEVKRFVTNSVEYLSFNQRPLAPNAPHNGNTSIFAGDTGKLVREAFALATQRCTLVQSISDLNCHDPTIVANQYVTTPLPESDPTYATLPYDPEKAGKLLDQAGFPVVDGKRINKDGTPLEIQLYTTTDNYRTIVSTLLQQQWEQALDLTISVHQIDGVLLLDTYQNGQLRSGHFDIALTRDTPPAESAIIASTFTSSETPSEQNPFGYNFGGVNDPQLETDFNLAITNFNEADRVRLYRQFQQTLVANADVVPLFFAPNVSLEKATLENYLPFPAEAPNAWNIADWWMDSPSPTPTSTLLPATPTPIAVSTVSTPVVLYKGHTGEILGARWSPDGQWIATAGVDHTVQVWNAMTGKQRLVYRGHTDAVYALAWSPDSRFIASSCAYYFDDELACSDASVQVWDAATGKTLTVFHGHSKDVPQIRWFPDGKRIISAARYDGKAFIWDAASGKIQYTRSIGQDTTVLALSHDGKRVITLNAETNTPEMWDSQTGATLVSFATSGRIQSALWSPDDRTILFGVANNDVVTYELWDTTGKRIGLLGNIAVAAPGIIAWSPDGQSLAIADGRVVWIIAVASQQRVLVYQGHDASVYRISGLVWSPDSRYVVSAGSDGVAHVWPVRN